MFENLPRYLLSITIYYLIKKIINNIYLFSVCIYVSMCVCIYICMYRIKKIKIFYKYIYIYI